MPRLTNDDIQLLKLKNKTNELWGDPFFSSCNYTLKLFILNSKKHSFTSEAHDIIFHREFNQLNYIDDMLLLLEFKICPSSKILTNVIQEFYSRLNGSFFTYNYLQFIQIFIYKSIKLGVVLQPEAFENITIYHAFNLNFEIKMVSSNFDKSKKLYKILCMLSKTNFPFPEEYISYRQKAVREFLKKNKNFNKKYYRIEPLIFILISSIDLSKLLIELNPSTINNVRSHIILETYFKRQLKIYAMIALSFKMKKIIYGNLCLNWNKYSYTPENDRPGFLRGFKNFTNGCHEEREQRSS